MTEESISRFTTTNEHTETIADLIAGTVYGRLAQWGTTARVSLWDGRQNVPLREVLDSQCDPLIEELCRDLAPAIQREVDAAVARELAEVRAAALAGIKAEMEGDAE